MATRLVEPIHTSKQVILSTFRSILRQINKQYTIRNDNTHWKQGAISEYRKHQTNARAPVHLLQLNAVDFLAFLEAKREHKRLVDEYWPASQLTEAEKLGRTAGMVGLSMPRALKHEETKAGGGQTWSEIQKEHREQQTQ
ncbi:hypothetical protein BDR26DRAFT_869372 [Obelidium mucronatum]|nr:hypothetical protein BDR26DRAFT_869372 [Obelidium mucronatum]